MSKRRTQRFGLTRTEAREVEEARARTIEADEKLNTPASNEERRNQENRYRSLMHIWSNQHTHCLGKQDAIAEMKHSATALENTVKLAVSRREEAVLGLGGLVGEFQMMILRIIRRSKPHKRYNLRTWSSFSGCLNSERDWMKRRSHRPRISWSAEDVRLIRNNPDNMPGHGAILSAIMELGLSPETYEFLLTLKARRNEVAHPFIKTGDFEELERDLSCQFGLEMMEVIKSLFSAVRQFRKSGSN